MYSDFPITPVQTLDFTYAAGEQRKSEGRLRIEKWVQGSQEATTVYVGWIAVGGSWFDIKPSPCPIPCTLTVTVQPPASFKPGTYSGTAYATQLGTNVCIRFADLKLTVVSQPPAPVVSPAGVVNGASFLPGISAGSWVAIFGQNLAITPKPGRIWRDWEIISSALPSSLDGASVRINGRLAAVYYVSPEQLNVQAPEDDNLGTVTVEVTTQGGTTRTTADLRRFAPALFINSGISLAEGAQCAAAVHADGAIVSPQTPARPRETIMLFGTGCGPSEPRRPAGQVIPPAPLANPFSVRIANMPASAPYGGIVGAGLCQFNVTVPGLPDGNHPVVIQVGGMETQPRTVIPVRR